MKKIYCQNIIGLLILVFFYFFLSSCDGRRSKSLKDPNYIKLENIITHCIDSASDHYLKFQDFKITSDEDGLPSSEIIGATHLVTFEGNVCSLEDIQWNGIVGDTLTGTQVTIKYKLGNNPNTGFFHPKNSCGSHNGWANFVKTDDGWRFVNFTFFF